MDIDTLRNEIATHLSDPAMQLVNGTQLLAFINSAARDAANEGWLLPLEENEATTLVADTWDYNVPASFYYISDLWLENPTDSDLYDRLIPPGHWEIAYDGGSPVIRLNSQAFTIEAGKTIKIQGQTIPSTYTAVTDTVDSGMESFLRERALSYAARYLAVGGTQQARRYAELSDRAFVISERLLSSHPQKFRMWPNARNVLLR